MANEKKVMVRKGANSPTAPAADSAGADASSNPPHLKQVKKWIVFAGVGVSLAMTAVICALYFLLGPGAAAEADPNGDATSAPSPLVPGESVALEPVNVNLASGYLQVGVTVQLAEGVDVAAFDTAAATDKVITSFSGKSTSEVLGEKEREAVRKSLLDHFNGPNDDQATAVYFTKFVHAR